ncbi:MAG: hypothetical protein HFE96_05615 [Acutalibacter sp.]|nr:hypothetical protein [Acutalibacter sp.]
MEEGRVAPSIPPGSSGFMDSLSSNEKSCLLRWRDGRPAKTGPVFTLPQGGENMMEIKNAPAQRVQEREFLVCRNDRAQRLAEPHPAIAGLAQSKGQ